MSSTPTITREQFLANLSAMPVNCAAIIEEDTTCIICITDPVDDLVGEDDECAVVLHDTHVFGERCIRQWPSENNTCPKCRAVLFEEAEEFYEIDQESDFDSDYEVEMADDMDAELTDEVSMTPAEFTEVLAEEDYEIAASTGLLDDISQVNRFRRDFCWLRDMDVEDNGGQFDDAELMGVYFDGTAFPDFDPDTLPLAVTRAFIDGTLPE
jgi:hypothetical protein